MGRKKILKSPSHLEAARSKSCILPLAHVFWWGLSSIFAAIPLALPLAGLAALSQLDLYGQIIYNYST